MGTGLVKISLFFSMFLSKFQYTSPMQCLSSSKKPVDWFVVYKVPRGFGFYYLDVDNTTWKVSDIGINEETHHAIANTLNQIYDNLPSSAEYGMYNDEPPISPYRCRGNCGHMKGVLAFDKAVGFWMITSIPQFPPPKSVGHYYFDNRSSIYGQSILCVTMNSKSISKIKMILHLTEAYFYDGNIRPPLTKNYNGKLNIGNYLDTVFSSEGNNQFRHFAKSHSFGKDLYDSLVAPSLKAALKVETWQIGAGGKLGSNCSVPFKVENIKTIGFDNKPNFASTKDHSKWAVTDSGAWTCIGDINRVKSQFKRGGGTMCFSNPQAHKSFQKIIKTSEKCP